ncbi:outer membrane transport energization protein TonB [Roseovarius tolerans]|uniref:Outer membrane transport energization protein TonB n=1 Tax=Roseovarius tolerans TaxID=74031 RepID=A0A1H8FHE4_9RHOB|nr:TonB family protein [Roseovarius tolerans]SEN31271.1 outer membrane transport energization protein TonB [Roseovarius tolerans]
MICTSRLMLSFCVAIAVVLHGLGAWRMETRPQVTSEGGAGASEVVLGSAFADMVAGTAQPVSNSTVTPNREAEHVARSVEAPAVRATPVEQVTKSVEPARADQVAPVRPAVATVPVLSARQSSPVEAAPPVAAAPSSRTSAEVAPKQTVEAVPETMDGVQVSRRPQARPREIEQQTMVRQTPEPARKAEVQGRSGNNATRDATRGSTTGRDTAAATRAGRETAIKSDEPGTAAASSYPGEVMRHLARVPRPRAEARGAALVQFSIAAGGRLASVGLAQSSGSTRLDRAALTVVQRAAPFPAPPAGAQRRFSVRIKGR